MCVLNVVCNYIFICVTLTYKPNTHLHIYTGGGYDNESVAISTMCLTFSTWMYALSVDTIFIPVKTSTTTNTEGKESEVPDEETEAQENIFHYIFLGLIAGLSYITMVATWGGYIFVCNLIGMYNHLCLYRRFPSLF